MSIIRLYCFAVLLLGLTACSSSNNQFASSQINSPTLADLTAQAQRYQQVSELIRLGGKIVSVNNQGGLTEIEILQLPLDQRGKPKGDRSDGRFIAVFAEFLDPALYQTDRFITVIASLDKTRTLKIGQATMIVPVLRVRQHRLWEQQPDILIYDRRPSFGIGMGFGSRGYRSTGFGIGF